MPFYPLTLDIRSRLCLVIGGGGVAARKIEQLLICGARVRVISPEVCAGVARLAETGRIEWRRRGYRTGDLDGAFLVFAATDNTEVQRAVTLEARERGIPINNADDPQECTFQVPASVRHGNLLLTVSTGGGSPALSAMIRKQLEQEYGPEYGSLVDLLAAVREQVVGDGDPPWMHKHLFERILAADVLSSIREADWPSLHRKLADVLPAAVDARGIVAAVAAAVRQGAERGAGRRQEG